MRVTHVEYSILKNLGNYEHQKVGVTVELEPGETPAEAFQRAKAFCEKAAEPGCENHAVKDAKRILGDPENHTPKQHRWASEIMETYKEDDNLPF